MTSIANTKKTENCDLNSLDRTNLNFNELNAGKVNSNSKCSGNFSSKGNFIDCVNSVDGVDLDTKSLNEQYTASNVSYTNENNDNNDIENENNKESVEINNISQMIKLDDEEAKLVPEEVKTSESQLNEKDQVLLNNRMRSKKRSEQMRKRLDKVSGEMFYFKYECGVGAENGENQHTSIHNPQQLDQHHGQVQAYNKDTELSEVDGRLAKLKPKHRGKLDYLLITILYFFISFMRFYYIFTIFFIYCLTLNYCKIINK